MKEQMTLKIDHQPRLWIAAHEEEKEKEKNVPGRQNGTKAISPQPILQRDKVTESPTHVAHNGRIFILSFNLLQISHYDVINPVGWTTKNAGRLDQNRVRHSNGTKDRFE